MRGDGLLRPPIITFRELKSPCEIKATVEASVKRS
jgi:hypothetical protein